MTQLETLIQTLCPNGVKFVKLGEVVRVLRGKRLTKSDLLSEALYNVYHGGIEPLGKYNEANREGNTVMVINVGASAGSVGFSKDAFWSSDGCFCLSKNDLTDSKFLYYYLLTQEKHLQSKVRKAGIPTLDSLVIENLQIPLPPLAVQSEIVRILDKFTLYKSELAAELAARLQQYEYYRDQLFTFGDDVERKTLGEIGTFTRGRRFCRTDIVDEGQSCIHYGDIYTYYGLNTTTTKTHLPYDFPVKLRYAEKGDVVIVGAGENDMDIGVGVVWEGNDSVAVHDACYIFKHNMNPRYISHYLRTINYHLQIKKYVNRGKICSISAEGIAKAVIPIPSLAEQERIASILDRFDKLCHDIREGLPAEIDLRQKQYEHYRDKLLTFEAKG